MKVVKDVVFSFSRRPRIEKKVNCQNWPPIKNFAICIKYFEDKFIKRDKKCNLILELHPVPTTYKDLKS